MTIRGFSYTRILPGLRGKFRADRSMRSTVTLRLATAERLRRQARVRGVTIDKLLASLLDEIRVEAKQAATGREGDAG